MSKINAISLLQQLVEREKGIKKLGNVFNKKGHSEKNTSYANFMSISDNLRKSIFVGSLLKSYLLIFF